MEYILVMTIVLAALLSLGHYIKRGLQGRWKVAVDDMGDQYDPRVANTSVLHTTDSFTRTRIETMNSIGGYWTSRSDETTSTESRRGMMAVGAY